MIGWLTSNHAAYVAAEVVEAGGTHELVIDTGFGGFLYISEDTISTWGLSFVSSVPIALAEEKSLSSSRGSQNAPFFRTSTCSFSVCSRDWPRFCSRRLRARARRDITVPTGISVTSAICL